MRVRQRNLMLAVRRKLRALGYTGIQTTGYVDSAGGRLVQHDLIVCGVYVMCRACGHRLTDTERVFTDAPDSAYYVQYGATHVDALCALLDAALARAALSRRTHWAPSIS